MKKNIVLHHNDRDGYAAAACEYLYDEPNNPTLQKEFISVDYSEPLIAKLPLEEYENANKIYLLDYSISTEANVEFARRFSHKIVWIDHHLSSIRTLKKYPDLDDIRGYRNIGLSGALLAWLYFNKRNVPDTIQILLLNNQTISDTDVLKIINICQPPKIIEYTHLYDTWQINSIVTKFNFGHFDFTVESIADEIKKDSPTRFSEIIMDGETIQKYIVSEYEKNIEEYGVPFTIVYRGNKYSCIMVNMHRPNSLKFGFYADEYDILMPFFFNGKKFNYSLYKGTKQQTSDLDVSKIAELFGGGGHKNAAGFVLDEPFKIKNGQFLDL